MDVDVKNDIYVYIYIIYIPFSKMMNETTSNNNAALPFSLDETGKLEPGTEREEGKTIHILLCVCVCVTRVRVVVVANGLGHGIFVVIFS